MRLYQRLEALGFKTPKVPIGVLMRRVDGPWALDVLRTATGELVLRVSTWQAASPVLLTPGMSAKSAEKFITLSKQAIRDSLKRSGKARKRKAEAR